jgi:hypothetical protein
LYHAKDEQINLKSIALVAVSLCDLLAIYSQPELSLSFGNLLGI